MPGGATPTIDPSSLFGPKDLTSTTKSTSEPWKPLQGPILDYIKLLQGSTFPGGNLAPYPFPDHQVSTFDPLQFFGQIMGGQQALQNAPLSAAGNQLAQQTMGGGYLSPGSNPWLDATYNQAARGVSDQYRYATAPSTQAEFARAGAYGGSAMDQNRIFQQYGLGQTLNNLATDVYGGNYQQERTRQQQQEALLPTLQQFGATIPGTFEQIGGQRQALNQLGMDTQFNNQNTRAQYPYEMLKMLGGGIGQFSNVGGSTSGSTTSPNPNLMSPLGALMAIENLQAGGGGGGMNNLLPLLMMGGFGG